jgi:hypothetical protein
MGILRKWVGAKSKQDKSLPYTYEARIDALSGRGADPLHHYYFSDTICGLIEYLDINGVRPSEVELFGVYRDDEIPLDVARCTTADGEWLARPHICRSLEAQFKQTLEERYRGHVDKGPCAFEDRDRNGIGPY